ncbi:MAG: DUF4388 domain-containing protein [Planctomycetes bacterium]|nr:DUF4388 domain-containing protein [Planctomycetota bacterium]
MKKLTARVDEEKACPVYHKGDTLEFTPPTVQGTRFIPLCMQAVGALSGPAASIAQGETPAKHQRTYCGGCERGKAWFSFEVAAGAAIQNVTAQFATFALNALRRMKLFAGVREDLLEHLVPLFQEQRVAERDVVVTAGEPGRAFHLIVEGQFAVLQPDDNGVENELARLREGDCFGEMSLITSEPVTATVRAIMDGVLLSMPKENFPRLLTVVPTMGMIFARILANRLARASSSILDEIRRGIIGRLNHISPAEIVQALNITNQTGLLSLQGNRGNATLSFTNGQVVDARLGTTRGEDAFYTLLGWTRGTFRFQPGQRDFSTTIKGDTVGLLLEGMRRLDEARLKLSAAKGK